MKIEVYGANHDPKTFFCQELAKKIARVLSGEPPEPAADAAREGEADEFKAEESERNAPVAAVAREPEECDIVFQSYLEIDYIKKLRALQKEHGGAMFHHRATELVIVDGKYVGDAQKFVDFSRSNDLVVEGVDAGDEVVHNRLVREEFMASVAERGNRPMVYMEYADGSKFTDETTPTYGKIVIELFRDVVPVAAENFLKLCTGELGATEMAKLHYQGCPVHRVVAGGWMQAGDIVLGDGSGSWAAVGKEGKVQDESFICDFSSSLGGMVGFSTSQAHSIGSQFFVTLGACEWMNGDYVGVGRVIQGFDTLRRISDASTTNQKPDPPILVVKSGKHIVV